MMEVPPPNSGVLGGMSQSTSEAPVQFYRFTNERKKQLRNDLYQDPFNPMATEENQPKDRTERPAPRQSQMSVGSAYNDNQKHQYTSNR